MRWTKLRAVEGVPFSCKATKSNTTCCKDLQWYLLGFYIWDFPSLHKKLQNLWQRNIWKSRKTFINEKKNDQINKFFICLSDVSVTKSFEGGDTTFPNARAFFDSVIIDYP